MAWTERYISSGAAGGGAGTSEGDPWTLAEFLANATSGMRGNVKADGAYSTAGTATNNGTAASPICLQGYSSTIGDLSPVSRANGGTGKIDESVLPTITATLTTKQYWWVRNLHFSANLATYLLQSDVFGFVEECVINNTNTTSSGQGVQLASNSVLLGCDVSAHQAIRESGAAITPKILFNRIRASGNASNARCLYMSNSRPSNIFGNQCWSQYGQGEGLHVLTATSHTAIANNSFYGLDTAIILDNGDEGIAVINNVAWDCTAFFTGTAATPDYAFYRNATDGTYNNTGDASNVGAVTLTADPYTAAGTGMDADFRLNKAPGAGLACRRAGMMGNDIGALQDQIRRLRNV